MRRSAKFCWHRRGSKRFYKCATRFSYLCSNYLCGRFSNLRNFTSIMLFPQEKISLLAKVRETAFFLAFFATALLAMVGWIYWLSSIVLKIVLWCFS
jgi:hypothetical protein